MSPIFWPFALFLAALYGQYREYEPGSKRHEPGPVYRGGRSYNPRCFRLLTIPT